MTFRPLAPFRVLSLGLLLTLASLLWVPSALADHSQISIFQDDQYLLYSNTKTVKNTLATLKRLGVQEIRVTVKWSNLAPDALSYTPPGGYFDPRFPNFYPAASWAPYDRVISLAQKDGIAVNLDITAPGPLWAMGKKPISTRAADHWYPNVAQWLFFVYAVALRYDGQYYRYPHVTSFSVWNEPDQPGWLSPQWQKIKGKWVAVAPNLYRQYVDAAYNALGLINKETGGHDQLLIGETAPEGDHTPNQYLPMTPLPFIRDMYCVGGSYKPLSGTAATSIGCPKTPDAATFVKNNAGLFDASGWAHHPYYFFHSPNTSDPDKDTAPIDDIGRLETALDRVMGAYGVHTRLPIYYTEYGYQTRPPNPYQTVTPAEQAVYLNEADYMAWNTPRVKSVAQFLLVDSAPDSAFPKSAFEYWSDSFDTGLEFLNHKPKPAYAAYRMPIWIPHPTFASGTSMFVWGQLRPASGGSAETAQVEYSGGTPGSTWTTLGSVSTAKSEGYFTTHVKPPGTGVIRIAWKSPYGELYSRSAAITAQ